MVDNGSIRFEAVAKRKAESLPRFIEVRAALLANWHLTETTPVEVSINGIDIGRRNMKPWGKGRDCWFLDLPNASCRKAAVETGDRIRVSLTRASTALPEELSALLEHDATAKRNWDTFTNSRRRMIADHVRSAQKPSTRQRRAQQAVSQNGKLA